MTPRPRKIEQYGSGAVAALNQNSSWDVEQIVQAGLDAGRITVPGTGTDFNLITGVTVNPGVAVGDPVYMNGGTAFKADASALANSNAFGVVESLAGLVAVVRVGSLSAAVFAGLTPGSTYFLGTSGGLTTTVPTGSGQVVLPIGRAYTSTRLVVSVGQRMVRS